MNKLVLTLFSLMILTGCSKELFSTNKAKSGGSVSPITQTNQKLCAQSTLVSPKVDILMLWDNSTSFNFVDAAKKASLKNLIEKVSEGFDYRILTAPMIRTNSGNAFADTYLFAKNTEGLTTTAFNLVKPKSYTSQLFFPATSGQEAGLDRAYELLNLGRNNGIFRQGAYHFVIAISSEDDESCRESDGSNSCIKGGSTFNSFINTKTNNLLSLANSMNSTWLRFVTIAPATYCSAAGSSKLNYIYKEASRVIYAQKNPNLQDDQYDNSTPDFYNLCATNGSSFFSKIETSINQVLVEHKYDYWPLAGANEVFDENEVRVVRSDGKELLNRAHNPGISNGFEIISGSTTRNTRYEPTPGEPFTGRMIRLYGTEGNDKIVYPNCLTIYLQDEVTKYGYVYLSSYQVNESSIELYLNGSKVPQSTTNGWSYMGLQNLPAASSNDGYGKVALLPAGKTTGSFIKLNGSYRFTNSNTPKVEVYFTSAAQ